MDSNILIHFKSEVTKIAALPSVHIPTIRAELKAPGLKAAPGIMSKTINPISAKMGSQRKTPGIP